jgi:hypothetical protein
LSTTADQALPEYAQWSLSRVSQFGDNSTYVKPTLLSAYGMLAYNADGKPLYRYWGDKTGNVELPIAGPVRERRLQLPASAEPSTVNVAARGIIESETRTRSLEYARRLHSAGLHVAQIYADGLIVEADALPFMPDGWRIAHELTNVRIPRANAIISTELTKLPGWSADPAATALADRRAEAMRPVAA